MVTRLPDFAPRRQARAVAGGAVTRKPHPAPPVDADAGGRPQACTGGPPASAIIASMPSAVTGPRNCLATRPSGAIR